uniref:Uncharacterized protein n=1 Tax=Oryza punctata TaxID=4537 RepID=A0A0E0JT36_ORYPU
MVSQVATACSGSSPSTLRLTFGLLPGCLIAATSKTSAGVKMQAIAAVQIFYALYKWTYSCPVNFLLLVAHLCCHKKITVHFFTIHINLSYRKKKLFLHNKIIQKKTTTCPTVLAAKKNKFTSSNKKN